MGVFIIRNNLSDKVFVGVGLDLDGIINRTKFQLGHAGHPNKLLQADWNEYGAASFSFEVVDQMTVEGDGSLDPREELAVLERLWLERLQPYGDRGYNVPKLSREQMLRRMAAKRLLDSDHTG